MTKGRRGKEVGEMHAAGLTRSEIAARLGMTANNVSVHLCYLRRNGTPIVRRNASIPVPLSFLTPAIRAAAKRRGVEPGALLVRVVDIVASDAVLIDNILDDADDLAEAAP